MDGVSRLYIVRVVARDLAGDPTDVVIAAGPYPYTDRGNEECIAAGEELALRYPEDEFRQILDYTELEVRLDRVPRS